MSQIWGEGFQTGFFGVAFCERMYSAKGSCCVFRGHSEVTGCNIQGPHINDVDSFLLWFLISFGYCANSNLLLLLCFSWPRTFSYDSLWACDPQCEDLSSRTFSQRPEDMATDMARRCSTSETMPPACSVSLITTFIVLPFSIFKCIHVGDLEQCATFP